MKVILRKDVPKVGRIGEIKNISDGFARNYLFPKRLAELATEGAVKNWALGEERRKARIAKEIEAAKTQSEKLAGVVLSFTRQVGENNQLFGSVGKTDIVKSLKASGVELDKDCIALEAPIKVVGDSEVTVNLKPGVSAKIKIRVAPKAV